MTEVTTKYGTPSQRPDKEKMQELILYLSVQSTGDSSWGVTKLNKLLFLIDFSAYLLLGKSITGHEYQKKQHGPCPTQINSLRDGLIADNSLEIEKVRHYNYNRKVPVAKRNASVDAFTSDELDMINKIRERWAGCTASEMSEKSHDFLGWKTAEHGATIPYGFALIEPKREPTRAEIGYAKMLGSIPIEERRKVQCVKLYLVLYNFRHVHKTARFKRELDGLVSEGAKSLDFVEAAELLLSRDPKQGIEVDADKGIWMLSMVEIYYEPKVLIFYEFDRFNVWLLSIVKSDLDEELLN